MDFLNSLQNFHFLRPYWLLALLPLALLLWSYSRTQSSSRSWASVIDSRLLPHLLQGASTLQKSAPVKTLFLLGSLLVFALSGPAFEKIPQPVFKTQSALTILLDLSLSMDATDIKPSRLSRAHFKINDILQQRKEGQTALIAYAADAYVVSPLTDDADTIISQIPALQTDIMPTQGSRLDIALDKARELFTNAGISKGHILVISDGINQPALDKIRQLNADNIQTSILATGTTQGAPIATRNGGFVKDSSGSIVVPKLNPGNMQKAARLGGGMFSLITADDRDINKLLSLIKVDKNKTGAEQLDAEGNKFNTDTWHEEGPWLLLLVIPFAAYAFRKGLVFVFIFYLLPFPQPAQAISWSELWNNSDQLGESALQQGDAEKAAELFNNPEWKAAAEYKSGQYQQAAERLSEIDTAEANYNRGNALAKSGQLDEAIKAYQRALEQNPEHEDAKHNLELLEQAKKQSQNQDSQQQNSQDPQSGDKQQNDNQQSQDSQQNQSTDQQEGSQSQSEQNQNSDGQSQAQQSNEQSNEQTTDTEQQNQQQAAESADDKKTNDEQTDNSALKEDENAQASDDDTKQIQKTQQSDATPDLNQQQTQQWLKRIPDDPGGLLRRKFKYQYGRDKTQTEQEQW